MLADMAAGDPVLDAAGRRRAQAAAGNANLFNEAVGFIVVGPMLALYATDVLRLDATAIAGILALAPLAGLVRFPLLSRIDRMGWVRVLRLGALARIAVVAALAALPAAWVPLPVLVALLLAFLAARELSLNTCWQPLLRSITTDRDRAGFFAWMRGRFFLVSAAAKAAIALYVGASLEDGEYRILLVAAAAGLLSHWWFVRRLPEPAHLGARSEGWPLRRLLAVARRSALLRRPLLVQGLLALAAFPLVAVYARQVLHLPAGLVALHTAAATIGTIAFLPLWGRLADSLGCKPVLIGLLALSVVLAPLPLLLPPAGAGAAWQAGAVMALWGLVGGALGAGIGIATTAEQHHLVRTEDAPAELGMFSVAIGALSAAGTLAAGWFVEHVAVPAGSAPLAGDWLHADPVTWWLVGFTPLATLAAIAIATGLPNARPLGVAEFWTALSSAPIRALREARRRHAGDEEERAAFCRFCAAHPNPMLLDPLLELAADPAHDVRVEAVRALGLSRSPLAGPALLDLLDAGNEDIADHLCWALGALRHAPAAPALRRRLGDAGAPRLRAAAARALGKLGDASAEADLLAALADPAAGPLIAAACTRALLDIGGRRHAGAALDALARLPDHIARYESLDALCEWLEIPNQWLFGGERDALPRERLAEAMRARTRLRPQQDALLRAMEGKDHQAVAAAFAAACAGTRDPVLGALAERLPRADRWTVWHLLAAARLLLAEDGVTSRT